MSLNSKVPSHCRMGLGGWWGAVKHFDEVVAIMKFGLWSYHFCNGFVEFCYHHILLYFCIDVHIFFKNAFQKCFGFCASVGAVNRFDEVGATMQFGPVCAGCPWRLVMSLLQRLFSSFTIISFFPLDLTKTALFVLGRQSWGFGQKETMKYQNMGLDDNLPSATLTIYFGGQSSF